MRKRLLAAWIVLVAGSVCAVAQEVSDRFYQAIHENDLKTLQALVKQSGTNVKDGRETTPLHYAAAFGSLDAMKILLAAKADPNAKTAFDATPLHWCTDNMDKVKLLVEHGASIDPHSKLGRTPLMIASAATGNSAIVEFLAEKGASVNVRDNTGTTPLLLAAGANDTAAVQFLLEKGAEINVEDGLGATPLIYAASFGNVDMMRMLLARHADVNAVSKDESQPVKNGPIALARLTALIVGAAYMGPDAMKVLLDAGAKVNVQDIRGMTPLMLAVGTDHPDVRVVRLLLERGADPRIKSREGETALDWARKFNHPGVLAALGMKAAQLPPAVLRNAQDTPKLTAREAAQKGLAVLERTAQGFFMEGGCVSCHAQNLAGIAAGAARANGLKVDEKAATARLQAVKAQWTAFEQPLLQRMDPPGAVDTLAYSAWQWLEDGSPRERFLDAMIHNLAAEQFPDGRWQLVGFSRPPMEDADFSRTAISIRALSAYPLPGRKAEFEQRIARAAAWLKGSKPRTTEDLDMRVMGLKWAKADFKAPLKDLLSIQRKDGGWPPTPELPSDAYSTGQALYALHEAGIPVTDAAYRKGVAYLLRTQLEDGTWHVASRAPRFQPYFQSGFPHGHDQWISSAGTAWAVAALSYASSEKPLRASIR